MEPNLGAVAGRQIEVGVPGNCDGFGNGAYVVGDDDGVDCVRSEGDGVAEVGLGEPVAAKVAGVDDTGDFLAARDVFYGDVIGLRLEDKTVHGMALSGGKSADVIGREGEGMALPLGGEGLAVGGELAADPVRVGDQERRTEPVAEVAIGVVVLIEHFLCSGQVGRGKDIHVAFAGEVGGDLQDFHAASGQDGDAGEFGFGGACGLAADGHDLLAADFGHVLSEAVIAEHACQKNRQGQRKNCV